MEHITKNNEILNIKNPFNQVFQQVKELHQGKRRYVKVSNKMTFLQLTMKI